MSTPNSLKDALHNTSRQNLLNEEAVNYARVANEEAIIYARGMVVGVVSTLMLNVSFAVAIRKLVEALPVDFLIETIPDAWKAEVFIEAKRQNKWHPAINKKSSEV